MTAKATFSSGFQGSESTSVDFLLYSHGDDPQLPDKSQAFDLRATGSSDRDVQPSLLSAQTAKSMGAPSGTWQVSLKTRFDLSTLLLDDDWVDIVFRRHGRPYHVMRGLLRDFRRVDETDGQGATIETWTLSGDEWSVIFPRTPVWFNRYAAENVGNKTTLQVFEALNVAGDPEETVEKILFGFLETLTGLGRANWEMPPAVPGRAENIVDAINFNAEQFVGEPERLSVSTQFMDPNGVGIWSLAQEWSDPMFCELWCDLGGPDGEYLDPDRETTPEQTSMTVFFRDRPFPTLDVGSASFWFTLPTTTIPNTHIVRNDAQGRTGAERYNAYNVNPQALQSVVGQNSLVAPLWDPLDVRRHGLRRFDVQSRYLVAANDILSMSSFQRRRIRDWHCLNPYLFSGTIQLGRVYPGIRIGQRVHVKGPSEEDDVLYYVEEVSHTWEQQAGGRTKLGVTRGWRGPEREILAAIETQAQRYQLMTSRGRKEPGTT